MTPPSHLAYVPFISVENMMRLVHSIGVETVLKELADAIEHDFTRWPLFDKTPRVGSLPMWAVIEFDSDLERQVSTSSNMSTYTPTNTKQALQTVHPPGCSPQGLVCISLLAVEMTLFDGAQDSVDLGDAGAHLRSQGAKGFGDGADRQCATQSVNSSR